MIPYSQRKRLTINKKQDKTKTKTRFVLYREIEIE